MRHCVNWVHCNGTLVNSCVSPLNTIVHVHTFIHSNPHTQYYCIEMSILQYFLTTNVFVLDLGINCSLNSALTSSLSLPPFSRVTHNLWHTTHTAVKKNCHFSLLTHTLGARHCLESHYSCHTLPLCVSSSLFQIFMTCSCGLTIVRG